MHFHPEIRPTPLCFDPLVGFSMKNWAKAEEVNATVKSMLTIIRCMKISSSLIRIYLHWAMITSQRSVSSFAESIGVEGRTTKDNACELAALTPSSFLVKNKTASRQRTPCLLSEGALLNLSSWSFLEKRRDLLHDVTHLPLEYGILLLQLRILPLDLGVLLLELCILLLQGVDSFSERLNRHQCYPIDIPTMEVPLISAERKGGMEVLRYWAHMADIAGFIFELPVLNL